jgi:hypothetical protein
VGWRAILVGAIALVALAGCGGSSHKSSTTSTSTPQVVTTAPASSYAHSGIAARLLTSSELPSGFTGGPPTVSNGVQAWVTGNQTPASQVASQTAHFKREGFVAGASEGLTGPNGIDGLSLVEEFHSPAGALAEFADDLSSFGSGVKTFSVPGIPKAHGFGGGTGSNGGANVSFVDGDYYYLVGEGMAPTAATEKALIDSAQKLYQRVHG